MRDFFPAAQGTEGIAYLREGRDSSVQPTIINTINSIIFRDVLLYCSDYRNGLATVCTIQATNRLKTEILASVKYRLPMSFLKKSWSAGIISLILSEVKIILCILNWMRLVSLTGFLSPLSRFLKNFPAAASIFPDSALEEALCRSFTGGVANPADTVLLQPHISSTPFRYDRAFFRPIAPVVDTAIACEW